MQLFEAICRAPRGTTSANDRVALRRLDNDRPKLLRHPVSSHEHIGASSKFFITPLLQYSISIGVISLGVMEEWSNGFSTERTLRRGGRAVDRAGLENRKAERSREFESHPLRSLRY